MDNLNYSVLATLAYYDALGMALTVNEVHKFLINPSRIVKSSIGFDKFTVEDIAGVLKRLILTKQVIAQGELFMLPGRDNLHQLRIEKTKIAQRKWKKFLKISRFLTLVPYLRGVFASGSLAMGNTDSDSDFDVLVIIQHGRLYTTRLILWILTSILGVRRKPLQVSAPNKLCFNHYITDNNLYIKHESLYNAQTYINLKPVFMEENLFKKFYSSNGWLNTYVYNFKPNVDILNYSLNITFINRIISRTGEFLLNNKFGDWIEKKAGKLQRDKILKNPVTYEPGGRVIFTDSELEFHPRSFERVVLARYKSKLTQLGVKPIIDEKDSGLRV